MIRFQESSDQEEVRLALYFDYVKWTKWKALLGKEIENAHFTAI